MSDLKLEGIIIKTLSSKTLSLIDEKISLANTYKSTLRHNRNTCMKLGYNLEERHIGSEIGFQDELIEALEDIKESLLNNTK